MKKMTVYECGICESIFYSKEDAINCETNCINAKKKNKLRIFFVGERGINIFGEIEGINCLIVNKLSTIKRNDIDILIEAKNIKTSDNNITEKINEILNEKYI